MACRKGWAAALAGVCVALAAVATGCGPCANLAGRRNVTVFSSDANAAEFQMCAQTGNCSALCDSVFEPESSGGLILDECKRVEVAPSGDQLTLAIRYHISSCD